MKNTLQWRDGKCYEIKPDGSEILIHNPDYESDSKSIKEDTAERAKSYITKYEQWLKDQTAMEEESKAKAAKTATNIETWRRRLKDKAEREKTQPEGKKYEGSKQYHEHEPYTYVPYQEVRIYHNIDPVRFRHTWMWLVKFYHNENFHKDTRWESDYGPNKKYKTWLEHQEALRAKQGGN